MVSPRQVLGARGEQAAAQWYEARGCRVLARNWRCADGELDLVLQDAAGTTVVICEVKTRRSDRFGSPFEAVTAVKQRKLRRLAGRWLAERRGSGLSGAVAVRFDVAGVTPDGRGGLEVQVIENAFG